MELYPNMFTKQADTASKANPDMRIAEGTNIPQWSTKAKEWGQHAKGCFPLGWK
jgi:hypothetical protein